MGNTQSFKKNNKFTCNATTNIVQGVKISSPKKTVEKVEEIVPKPPPKKKEIQIFNDLNNLYLLKNLCYGRIDKYFYELHNPYNCYNNTPPIQYDPDVDYKNYVNKSSFLEVTKLTSYDNVITLPSNYIISNIKLVNIEDINLIESMELIINDRDTFDTIHTSIFKQLQSFYKINEDNIPFFIFKYGFFTRYQTCKIKINFKKDSKKEISILINKYINLNNEKSMYQTPMYFVKEVEIENDKTFYGLNSPSYFFIPEKKINDIKLLLNNQYQINLEYDDNKHIVPLVNGLDSENYKNYMLNFSRIDIMKLSFNCENEEKIKAYFICPCILEYRTGFIGLLLFKN